MKKRRKYTREFKISVITELDAGKTIAQVSREYNLHPSMITRWKREYNKDPESAFRGNGVTSNESRIAELERLVGKLYAENAFLKNALERLREQKERR
jgi:transposase